MIVDLDGSYSPGVSFERDNKLVGFWVEFF